MKPKLNRSEKFVRKDVLDAFLREYPESSDHSREWALLRRLLQIHDVSPSLREQLSSVIDQKSINGYLALQRHNDPQQYRSPTEFYSVTSVLSFLKKFPFGKVADLDPLAAAEASSIRAELLCRITNRRLRYYRDRGYRQKLKWRGLHSIFHTARLFIASWLGPVDLNEIYEFMRHGPGGAIGVTGSTTTAYYKYAALQYTVTTRALPYAEAAILADPLWRRFIVSGDSIIGDPVPSPQESRLAVLNRLKVVDSNKVTYVPKTAQTHRAIAIEPLMNIYLQLGVGDYMTQKMRKYGLNLRSQAKNQYMARDGSTDRLPPHLRSVTLDLSMASDTLSIELVRDLLPEDWFNLLNDLRSEFGSYGGKEVRWAKFSSMGNGFTFQLESIIFYALAQSVARHLGYERNSIAVYGDDIICPAGMALRLVEVLSYSGFTINKAKSYLFGPFRESCGTDWFEGVDVRPFFLKRKIQNARDYVFLYNSFRKRADLFLDQSCNSMQHRNSFCEFVYYSLPQLVADNLLGPPTEALEGHIHSSLDFASKSRFVKWDMNVQTWSYASIVAQPREYRGRAGPLILQLLDHYSSGRDTFQPRAISEQVLLWYESLYGSPVKRSAVTRRKSVRYALATQTSNGWRND